MTHTITDLFRVFKDVEKFNGKVNILYFIGSLNQGLTEPYHRGLYLGAWKPGCAN